MSSIRRGAAVAQRYVVSLYFVGGGRAVLSRRVRLARDEGGSNIDNAKSLDAHRGFRFI
jgi:hypothetical protein